MLRSLVLATALCLPAVQTTAEPGDLEPLAALTNPETQSVEKVLKGTLETVAKAQAATANACFPDTTTADHDLTLCLEYAQLMSLQTEVLYQLLQIAP